MTIFDWIIIMIIAVGLFFAIRYIIKHKGSCCSGSCSSCSRNCNGCNIKDKEHNSEDEQDE